VILAVARQRADALEHTGRGVAQLAERIWRHIRCVEIDKVHRVGHAVRIMAGCAGGFVIHNMALVESKAGVAQYDRAAVAFVAKRVGRRTFGLKIFNRQIAFEQRTERRTVRAVRATATSIWPAVAVVAIGAINHAVHIPRRRNQARHARGIFPGGLDWMKTLVAGGELQPRVRLRKLPRHRRLAAFGAVGVAAKTNFVFLLRRFDDTARRRDARDAGHRAGNVRRDGDGFVRRVRIVAVGAGDVTLRRIDRVFVRAVRIAVERDRMNADFVKIRLDIFLNRRAVVTNEAILFGHGGLHDKFFTASVVRDVTAFTADGREC